MPLRYRGYAIYDIRRLILPRTPLEERIFLEATRRIPVAFGAGPPWGEELREGALWIAEPLHDRTYREIRSRLRADAAYLQDLTRRMATDVDRLGAEVSRHSPDPAALLEACISAVAWFATNWLHPLAAVRMAVARLLGDEELDAQMGALLGGASGQPVYLQAYLALAGVREGAMTDADFRRQWGPLYALGDEPGRLAEPGAAALAAAREAPADTDTARLMDGARQRTAEAQALTGRLLAETREHDGPAAADLLEAQLAFLRQTVWEEEMRHLYQQQSYAILREGGSPCALH